MSDIRDNRLRDYAIQAAPAPKHDRSPTKLEMLIKAAYGSADIAFGITERLTQLVLKLQGSLPPEPVDPADNAPQPRCEGLCSEIESGLGRLDETHHASQRLLTTLEALI